jgi:hypothetical protein
MTDDEYRELVKALRKLPDRGGLAALVPDPLRRRTLLDQLRWWRR